MTPATHSPEHAWYTRPFARRAFRVLLAALAVGCFINGVLLKHNDFRLHYGLGEQMLRGHAYRLEGTSPRLANYPPGRLVFNVALGALPYRVSRALCWLAAVATTALSLWAWHRLAQRRRPTTGRVAFAAATGAVFLTVFWVVRDLDDCGLQLLLLGLLTAAAWAVVCRRDVLAGLLVAVAVTYKVTPVIFVGLLAYKRRWRATAAAVLMLPLLNLLMPAAFLGWRGALDANATYLTEARRLIAANRDDPTANGLEPPRHQNRSLKLAIVRFLQTYRPGRGPDGRAKPTRHLFLPHPDDVGAGGRVPPDARPHPLFVQFLDLPAATANAIAMGILLALAAGLAVLMRRRWGPEAPSAEVAPEWAAVAALAALLAPLCWGQHLVLVLPAAFLALRANLARREPLWRRLALGAIFVLNLIPQRIIVGYELSGILYSYKTQTLAALLAVGLVLTIPKWPSAAPLDDRHAGCENQPAAAGEDAASHPAAAGRGA